jgi:hypothetical protein
MADRDESLIDKVKNALGMGGEDEHHDEGADERAEGWAGVPEALHEEPTDTESGLGRNPGPVGSARYEGGSSPADLGGTDVDPEGGVDTTREDAAATEFGGAYGEDDTPAPTAAAWDRGEAAPGDASFGEGDEREDLERRGTGI